MKYMYIWQVGQPCLKYDEEKGGVLRTNKRWLHRMF